MALLSKIQNVLKISTLPHCGIVEYNNFKTLKRRCMASPIAMTLGWMQITKILIILFEKF